jgi:hypothetical protein
VNQKVSGTDVSAIFTLQWDEEEFAVGWWAVVGAPAAGKKRKASDGLETEDGKGDEVEVEDART